MTLTRRQTLTFIGGAAALAACSTNAPASPVPPLADTKTSLKDLAAAKGLRFGTAMSAAQVDDAEYVEIVRRECATIVGENEFKMYAIVPNEGVYDWARADKLADFAQANDLMLRGHTMIWSHPRWLPDWLNATTFTGSEARAYMDQYIGALGDRFPQIYSWDVINEAIDDETGDMRETPFTKAMGGVPALAYAFEEAKRAAPGATLAYNDYMSWESGNENHRTGVLRLLEALLEAGAPIDALGIQSHSNRDKPREFTGSRQREWRGFVDEAVGMGLDIYLTEFDVDDEDLDADIASRDAEVAAYTKDYLDMMLSYTQTKDVLMWGMVDDQSWLQTFQPRTDGVAKRPTLYDEDYQPKAMREAVANALRAAPVRT